MHHSLREELFVIEDVAHKLPFFDDGNNLDPGPRAAALHMCSMNSAPACASPR